MRCYSQRNLFPCIRLLSCYPVTFVYGCVVDADANADVDADADANANADASCLFSIIFVLCFTLHYNKSGNGPVILFTAYWLDVKSTQKMSSTETERKRERAREIWCILFSDEIPETQFRLTCAMFGWGQPIRRTIILLDESSTTT
uniref:Uncharacterized protein n=1 Tax=Glossina palpalis gambiensis TaxID=67801 RepID=A0A1B0B874_9MUSC